MTACAMANKDPSQRPAESENQLFEDRFRAGIKVLKTSNGDLKSMLARAGKHLAYEHLNSARIKHLTIRMTFIYTSRAKSRFAAGLCRRAFQVE